MLSRKRLGNYNLDKCGVDWISQLPDDIIIRILSFLPLKDAATTSVVSSRWENLWKRTGKLNFLESGLHWQLFELCLRGRQSYLMHLYVEWVNSVIKSCQGTTTALEELTIVFIIERCTQHHVVKWLQEFAFSRRVRRVNLMYKFPWHDEPAVLEEILKEINVDGGGFDSLRVLHLRWFQMRSGEDAIGFFVRKCWLLERLVLDGLIMTSDLELVSGSLKHLDLRSRESHNSVKVVSAPNLTWLTVDHGSKRVFLKNVPKLVNMNFVCRSGDSMHDFAASAHNLETLIITLYHPKAWFSVPDMPRLKKLVVYYRDVEENVVLPVTCFIRASPCLEEFKLEVGELAIDRDVFEIPKDDVFRHEHLKLFVLSGFCGGAGDRVALVEVYCG